VQEPPVDDLRKFAQRRNRRPALKELRAEIAPRKKSARIREIRIRKLTAELAQVRKQLESSTRQARRKDKEEAPQDAQAGLRFRPAGLAAHRKRLGLSGRERGNHHPRVARSCWVNRG
jgi:hypothetical protein